MRRDYQAVYPDRRLCGHAYRYSSSVILMVQAGQAAEISNAQIASWILGSLSNPAWPLCTSRYSLRVSLPAESLVLGSTPGRGIVG